jgi:hypothetical protein
MACFGEITYALDRCTPRDVSLPRVRSCVSGRTWTRTDFPSVYIAMAARVLTVGQPPVGVAPGLAPGLFGNNLQSRDLGRPHYPARDCRWIGREEL